MARILLIEFTFFEGQIISEGEFLGREVIEDIARQFGVEPFEDTEERLCVAVRLPVAMREPGAPPPYFEEL